MSAMGDGHNGLAAPQKTDSRLSRDQTCLAHSQFEHCLFNLLSSQHQCLCLTFHSVIPPNSTKFPSQKPFSEHLYKKVIFFAYKRQTGDCPPQWSHHNILPYHDSIHKANFHLCMQANADEICIVKLLLTSENLNFDPLTGILVNSMPKGILSGQTVA